MSNPNFVSDLVAMAKAFEELPTVTAERDAAKRDVQIGLERIQQLELRLIDRANEIDALNAAVRKAEVERDHAEQMFLETDDRLNAFRQLVQRFRAEVETYDAVADKPEAAESMTTEPAEPFRQEYRPTPDVNDRHDMFSEDEYYQKAQPVEAITKPIASEDHIDMGLGNVGQSAQGEPTSGANDLSAGAGTDATQPQASSANATPIAEGVSVSDYPTSANSPSEGSASPVDTAPATADANVDDVSYANEPKINSSEPGGWEAWDAWANRMNQRYGAGQWPARPSPMQSAAQ